MKTAKIACAAIAMPSKRRAFPTTPSLIYEGDWQLDSGLRALPYLLGKNVTGIFAFNDMIAYGVYKQARNYNLCIPEDISVVGFDDLIFSDLIDPPLTTLEYPVVQMGEAVVERILAKINGEERDLRTRGHRPHSQSQRQHRPIAGIGKGLAFLIVL